MSKYTKLSSEALANLTSKKWNLGPNRTLYKRYALPTHTAAGKFVFELAKESDKLNHHPEFTVRYRFVTVNLRTNDIDDISDYDNELAIKSDELKKLVSDQYQSKI